MVGGYDIGKSAVQKHLVTHGLGRRAQRLTRAAAITAGTTGLSTEAARDIEQFGFCHYSPAPGYLVAADTFYIGNLKGVGKVYQRTAMDVATRWAIILIVVGTPTAMHTIHSSTISLALDADDRIVLRTTALDAVVGVRSSN